MTAPIWIDGIAYLPAFEHEKIAVEVRKISEQYASYREAAGASIASDHSFCATEIERLNAHIRQLEAALTKAADTFADIALTMTLLQRPLVADSCEIAERGCRNALRSTSESQ